MDAVTIFCDQSKGLDEHIPKGHTPWELPLSYVYKPVFPAINNSSVIYFSLNLVTTEYTSTRYQHDSQDKRSEKGK
jgi:hypothetical protein